MEYLQNINDNLKLINEDNIVYYDLFNFPELFYGTLNFTSHKMDFSKFSNDILDEMQNYGNEIHTGIKYYNHASCGNRLRFSTSSEIIIFKVQLKRKYPFQKLINWNSMGFDIYEIKDGKYLFKAIFSPMDGYNIFSEVLRFPANTKLCVFLPNYNIIEKIYLGVEKGSKIVPVPYPPKNRLPVIFYGNSITQGAAASKSGNSFPNIISRKLDRDIINLSSSSGCLGTESIAELIGKINCNSIVIDYTKNAPNLDIFANTYEKFYKRIRDFHPDKKIILLTSEHFNEWGLGQYDQFDEIVMKTYRNAKSNGENTELVYQKELFDEDEWDYAVVDAGHYTDYGMFKVADVVCDLLK